MAGQLVGEAFLSAFLEALVGRMASREVLDYFRSRKLSDGWLKKLKTTLLSIKAVLNDAEDKQSIKPDVENWLHELKDAVYDAEDLLGEIAYEALRCKLENEPQTTTSQVRNYLSSLNPFDKGMRSKLEEILDRLEYMATQIHVLGLKVVLGDKLSGRTPSTSLVDEAVVYGRDNDKEAVVKLLLSEDSSGNDIGVIPILGMGGLGKTTLAQLVYNDSQVEESFALKAWVCVSEEFDVFKVTKTILQEVVPGIYDDSNLNQLQLKLKQNLIDKKFLLVLDDVWNKNYMDWEILQRPFRFGAKGSRIIVTTRDQRVASIMKTLPTYVLQQLTDADCWLLFAKHAFTGANSSKFPKLEEFCQEILKRCKGLPLAAKALGGVLRSKVDGAEWDKILKSSIWDDDSNILPVLKLSYYHLPSKLKQCFAYCSIFPKDYEFEKGDLIRLWMAEGFLDDPQSNKKMDKVGEEYFRDLVARSFFQRSSCKNSRFVMHDLINDLAQAVSAKFCCRLEGEDSCEITMKTHHLSNLRAHFDESKKFKSVDEALHLRTFLTVCSSPWQPDSYISSMVTHKLLPKLRCLRVISLAGYRNVSKLSDSISDLKQLRYLDFSNTSIERLPESVSALYNLQTLIMFRCWQLVALPTNLGRLINLHVLDIRETRVKEMPMHMGRLENLQVLTTFVVGKQSGCTINELKELHHLRGTLSILSLQNLASSQDASEALLDKKRLQKLELSWDNDGDAECSKNERDILNSLHPHANLEDLVISGYRGTIFPNWVGDCSFLSIECLRLSNCKNCLCLPCLGQLPSLKELRISAFDAVVSIGAEFSGASLTCTRPFRLLLKLEFMKMPMWEEWSCADGEDGAFPRLQVLKLKECPKLKKILPSHLPSLRELQIQNCQELEGSLPMVPALRDLCLINSDKLVLKEVPFGLHELRIGGCLATDALLVELAHRNPCLEQLSVMKCSRYCLKTADAIILHSSSSSPVRSLPLELFSKLKGLFIADSDNLENLSTSEGPRQDLMSLHFLDIFSCSKLASFPKGGISAPNLTSIGLLGCSSLKSLPQHMHSLLPSLEELVIIDCPEIESFPQGGLPSSLKDLTIMKCSKLITARGRWGLKCLPSLTSLLVSDADLESFPEENLLPSSLTILSIDNFQNLKSVDGKGLRQLTSIRELDIEKCSKLECLPQEGLPSSLSVLSIRDCPSLSQQCQKEKGHYWSKISHLRTILIDDMLLS